MEFRHAQLIVHGYYVLTDATTVHVTIVGRCLPGGRVYPVGLHSAQPLHEGPCLFLRGLSGQSPESSFLQSSHSPQSRTFAADARPTCSMPYVSSYIFHTNENRPFNVISYTSNKTCFYHCILFIFGNITLARVQPGADPGAEYLLGVAAEIVFSSFSGLQGIVIRVIGFLPRHGTPHNVNKDVRVW